LEILPGDMIVIGKVGSNFTPRLITEEKRGVVCPKKRNSGDWREAELMSGSSLNGLCFGAI